MGTRGGKILMFANLKGGVGKTTNAVAVAEALAVAGSEVLVIDADPQGAASALLLGKERFQECDRRQATLHDLLRAMLSSDFEASDFEAYVARRTSNIGGGLDRLAVIPCSLRRNETFTRGARRGENGSMHAFDAVLQSRRNVLRRWLCDHFDYTIVDCPPSVPLQVNMFLRMADGCVMPSVPDELSVRGSFQFLDQLRRLGTRMQPLGTLWTMYRASNEVHNRVIRRAARRREEPVLLPRPFKSIIPNATAISRACDPARTFSTFAAKYETPFARIYEALCGEIVARLNPA